MTKGISCLIFLCFQAEDGIRDLVRSRGLGDVYKRQRVGCARANAALLTAAFSAVRRSPGHFATTVPPRFSCIWCETRPATGALRIRVPDKGCLLYTSDAADERSSVDLGGRRIIKKNK